MAPIPTNKMVKTIIFVSLLLFIVPLSSGISEGFKVGTEAYPFSHDKVQGINVMGVRKLLVDVLDYDDTGPNTKHDPRKPKPGKNP